MSIKSKEMTFEERLARLKKLIYQFKEGEVFYTSKDFVESEVRSKFIDPFLECLKWDVKNEKGARYDKREVITEDRIVVDGQKKHPDYTLCCAGVKKIFVEAKKPSVNLKLDPAPALQVRRYAYTAKLPIAILTDFQELAIYDTRIKPTDKDTASTARIEYLTYDKYEEKFEELYNHISWDAVDLGKFDTYYESAKEKRGTASVDEDILGMIERWRVLLAEDIALHNTEMNETALTSCVQKLIDRLLFLRIAEDKEIEPVKQLQKIATEKENIYAKLKSLFAKCETRFNAGLFTNDDYLNSLKVQDKTLITIITELYYPICQYEFSVLPVEILGNIYERFLGKIIRFKRKTKNGHSIEIVEKPEVQKSGGVYYTPSYIVDYIVKETVGKKIENATPEKVSKLKVCDPACGSGSFLVGAYQYLLDWYLDYYYKEERRESSEKKGLIYKDDKTREYKLSIEEKRRILLANIYGVDIDRQAVEVTKLSLFLKLLENEGKALSKEGQASLFKTSDITKILPSLTQNIKCGNSLIGKDYYDDKNLSLIGIEEQRKVNAFDWKSEFVDVFKCGGFDCVIGNPPYVRIQTLNKTNRNAVEYYNKKYSLVVSANYDLYLLFIYQGYILLHDDGILGFIQPHKFFQGEMGKKLRKLLKNNTAVSQIVDFTTNQIFSNATTYTCLLFLTKMKKNTFLYKRFDLGEDFTKLKDIDFIQIDYSEFSDDVWFFNSEKNNNLLKKLQEQKHSFKDITKKIFKGSSTGNDKIFLFDLLLDKGKTVVVKSEIENEPIELEKTMLKKFLYGESVRRYGSFIKIKYLLFPYKKIANKYELINSKEMKKNYPLTFQYLTKYKTILMERKITLTTDNFYKYSAARSLNDYEKPKILIPDMLISNRIGFDSKGEFFTGAAIHCPIFNEIGSKISEKVYLAILNSKVFWFFVSHKSTALASNAYRLTPEFISSFSFPELKKNECTNWIITLVDQMLEAHKELEKTKFEEDKKFIQQRIDILDSQINSIVYKLYNLNEKEIKIVEE
ncbi:MAG: Eco57I restriction-modification methylase domain-containing protein [Treponema sp.]